ncbi:EamA family transporter [Paractinoplanes toevensis]|uniref:Membrane protein n=1 Tax=Paractinoplanes toevensis TaxID=571911 RepID=A0A919W960_9ACTN|nr:EamA family transporter [Actinoplanes toevensis]GIM95919.1 membrane protein [Actinoplanes toevensis]
MTTQTLEGRKTWLLVLAGCLWGTGGLTGSLLARHTGLAAPSIAAYRLAVGGLILLLFVRNRPRGRAAWTRIVVLGLLAAEFQACYFAAVSKVSVSLATLITIGASPVLVLAVESLTGRRKADRGALGTAGLAVIGLTLLIGVPSSGQDLTTVLSGAGFALLAAGGFAAMTVIGSRPVPGLDEMASTGFAFTLGAAVLAAGTSALGGGLGFTPDRPALGLLLLLGAGPTAIAYAAYFRGLRTARAGTAALMALLEPLVGTALSVLVLGDRLGPAGIAGAALLLTALVLEGRRG